LAYATIQDMIDRFTQTEVLRLSANGGDLPNAIVETPVLRALDDATSMVEGYLRRRVNVPLVAPYPAEVTRAVCILARYDLATGGEREPSTQMRNDRNDVVSWLNKIAEGYVSLEGAVPAAQGGRADALDRPRMFGHDELGRW
jgi:phage gp36-like protein